MALRSPPPLRTGRASFPASGSSLRYRPNQGTGQHPDRVLPSRYAIEDSARVAPGSSREVPGVGSVGGCTRVQKTPSSAFLLSCLINLSRDGRPRGSQLAFAPDIGVCIQPTTGWHLLSPRSDTRSPIGSPYGSLSPEGRATGLPRSAYAPKWVGPRFYAGDHFVCGRTSRRALLRVTYLLVQAFCLVGTAPSACLKLRRFYQRFTFIGHTIYPTVRPPVLAVTARPHG